MNAISIRGIPIRPHAKNGRIGWVQREAANQMLLGRTVTVTSLRLRGKARDYSARYVGAIRNLDANPNLFEAGSFGPRGGFGFRAKIDWKAWRLAK